MSRALPAEGTEDRKAIRAIMANWFFVNGLGGARPDDGIQTHERITFRRMIVRLRIDYPRLEECTTMGYPEENRPPDARTRSRLAFNDYLAWAAATNRKSTMTETAFGIELGRLVTKKKERGANEYFFGLVAPPTQKD